MRIEKLSDHTGAEVTGVDLSQPVDADTKAALNKAFSERSVLVVRDQQLDPNKVLSAVQTIIGTRLWLASTTGATKCAAAVPDVHSSTAGKPDALPMPSAANPALRSSWKTWSESSDRRAMATASGVDRLPGATTAWVTPWRIHSSTRVAQKAAEVSPGVAMGPSLASCEWKSGPMWSVRGATSANDGSRRPSQCCVTRAWMRP